MAECKPHGHMAQRVEPPEADSSHGMKLLHAHLQEMLLLLITPHGGDFYFTADCSHFLHHLGIYLAGWPFFLSYSNVIPAEGLTFGGLQMYTIRGVFGSPVG